MDNLVIQIQHRPKDAEGFVPQKTLYLDRNFTTLQGGIHDGRYHMDLPGIVTNPGLCTTGMCVSWNDFVCFAPGGILCDIPSGSVGLCEAGLSHRIDIVTVDPLVQYDADDEIMYSGSVEVLAGITPTASSMMPNCPVTSLKIGEIDVPAGITDLVLREWTPNYVQESMLKPYAQDPPGMTININPWRGFVGICCSPTVFRGGTTAFSLPGDSGIHRLDLVSLTPGATISVIAGLSVTSPSEPVSPSLIAGDIPIAQVYLYGEQDYISQAEIIDIRSFASGYSCGLL